LEIKNLIKINLKLRRKRQITEYQTTEHTGSIYSASIGDVATVDWRFNNHNIDSLNKKKIYSDVDLLFPNIKDPAQSESVEAVKIRFLF
jgi:hypothetical protein